jgi:hypothetical protein
MAKVTIKGQQKNCMVGKLEELQIAMLENEIA